MEILGAISSAIATIVVAVIGIFTTRSNRRSAKEKELQAKLDKQKAEKEDKIIKDLQASVDNLTKLVTDLTDNLELHGDEITYLSTLSKASIDYTKEISNVITALAEGLRDNNIDGNVSRAIESFRKFESSQLQTMYRIMDDKRKRETI